MSGYSAEEIASKLEDAKSRTSSLKEEIAGLEVRSTSSPAWFCLHACVFLVRRPLIPSLRSSFLPSSAVMPTSPCQTPRPTKKTKRRLPTDPARDPVQPRLHCHVLWQAYEKAMAAKEAAVMCMENGDHPGAQV